jgi:4-amino-4-deoxy-L-arabinose transferase-like glycosyltransferase
MTRIESLMGRGRLVLAIVVAAALGVRLWGLSFGLPHVLARPDELFVFGVAFRMLGGDPNPNMFDYPGVYLYFVAGLFALYYWWTRLTGGVGSVADFRQLFEVAYEPFFLLARGVTAISGALTVWVCHAIAAPLFGRAAGLLSAFFLAFAFLHVRDSHYATTDVPLTLFVMCAVLAALRVHRTRSARQAWMAGVAAGLATGIKYNAAPVVVPLAVVEALHAWTVRRDWRRMLRETHLWLMALGVVVTFLVTNPYLVLDYGNAMRQLQSLAAQASTGMTPPEMLGSGWGYHLPFSLRHGLGIPLLGAGLLGMAWMAVRRPALALILGSFPVAYYVAAGAGYNVFVRYMVPVAPFLCLFAGYLVAALASAVAARVPVPRAAVAGALAVAIVAPSAWSVVQLNRLLAEDDSRVLAAEWVDRHVPAGSSVYMSGNRYGHPQIEGLPGEYRIFGYDWRASTFTHQDRSTGEYREYHVAEYPDVIIVQRSAIPYSHIPKQVEQLLPDVYRMVHQIRAADLTVRNPYDIQDGFYLAYGRYQGVRRPGPNIEIHQRRDP